MKRYPYDHQLDFRDMSVMPSRMVHFVISILIGLASVPLAAQERTPVFVQAGSGSSGFTNPSKALNDSAADIAGYVNRSKTLRFTSREDLAAVIIEVLSRQEADENTVHIRLIARGFSMEFDGIGDNYREAASEIVKQLETWVRDNKAKLQIPAELPTPAR